jgi:hypothetical protein
MDFRHQDLFHSISIHTQYAECLAVWGIGSLPAEGMIHAYRFEGVSKRQMACASYPGVTPDRHMRIGVSGEEWGVYIHMPIFRALKAVHGEAYAKEKLRLVIIHELAHIAARFSVGPVQHHGSTWGNFMIAMGLGENANQTGIGMASTAYQKSPDKYSRP